MQKGIGAVTAESKQWVEPKLEPPTDAEIDAAIRETDYKYFGDYPLSDGQWDAIITLIRAAKALKETRK